MKFLFSKIYRPLTHQFTTNPSFKPILTRATFKSRSNPLSILGSFRSFSSGPVMTKDMVKERVLNVLKAFDKVNAENLKLESQFVSDLGLDSLDVVEVIMAIEEEFSLEIPDSVADGLKSPQEAAEYIYKKITPDESFVAL